MTMFVEVADAQIRLPELVSKASAGDEIVLVDHGKPIARLLPAESIKPRTPGLHEGQGWISDDFNDPLPEEYWLGTE